MSKAVDMGDGVSMKDHAEIVHRHLAVYRLSLAVRIASRDHEMLWGTGNVDGRFEIDGPRATHGHTFRNQTYRGQRFFR